MEKPRANLTVGHTLLCKCTPDVGLRVGQPSPNEISDPKIKPSFFFKMQKANISTGKQLWVQCELIVLHDSQAVRWSMF